MCDNKQSLADEIRSIKYKYYKQDTNTSNKKRVLVSFYKSDIKEYFFNKKNRELAKIGFPKSSKYYGFVWYYPKEWIYSNNTTKNHNEFSFSPDKRWINVPNDYVVKITSQSKTSKVIEKEISSSELKEEMKRPFSYFLNEDK